MDADPLLIDLPERREGPRIVLRPYRAGDGAQMFEAVRESLDHIMPWLPWGPKHETPDQSEATVRRFQANWVSRSDLGMGIFDRESGRFLGGVGLHRVDWDLRSFEIGYWVRASAHGKGYVTEAVKLLVDLAFELKANRVHIRCAADNLRSAAVAERLGFHLEGTLRNAIRDANGGLHDMLVYSLIPGDSGLAGR